MNYEWLILTFSIAVLIRFLPLSYVSTSTDTYGHLYYLKELKKQKKGPFSGIKTNVIGSTKASFYHPFLWHYLFKLFHVDFLIKNQKFFNPIIDTLYSSFVFFVLFQLGFSQYLCSIGVLLYVLTPMWFSTLSVGPRVTSFTPRLMSEIILSVFFFITVYNLETSYLNIIFLSSLLATYILMSTKFGLQAIILISIPYILLSFDLSPLYSIIIGILFSLLISKGKSLNYLKTQFRHLIWYYNQNKKKKMHISNRNSINYLLEQIDHKDKFFVKFVRFIKLSISTNSFIGLFVKMPIFIFCINSIIQSLNFDNYNVLSKEEALIVSSLAIFLLINISTFLFLGESERYINHISLIIIIYFLTNYNDSNLPIYLLTYGLIFWFFEIILLRKNYFKLKLREDSFEKILNHLKKLNDKVVAIYPYNYLGGVYRIMLETDNKVVFNALIDKKSENYFKKNFDENYPYFRLNNFEKMTKEFNINLLILSNKSLLKNNPDWNPGKDWRISHKDDFLTTYEHI